MEHCINGVSSFFIAWLLLLELLSLDSVPPSSGHSAGLRKTALVCACGHGHVEAARLLLEANAIDTSKLTSPKP